MKKSYLNSERNTAVTLKPSKAIRLLLIVLLFSLAPAISFGQVTIAQQDFENTPASPVMTFTNNGGSVGNITPGFPTNATTAFAGTRGYYVSGTTATLTSNSDIDTRCYSSPSLSFKLAALDNSSGRGLDVADIVTVAISIDGGAIFTNEMTVAGNSNAFWSYTSGTGTASSAYDGNGTVEGTKSWSPVGGGARTTDGYSKVILTGLPNTASLRIKITLKNNSSNEIWAIDNVVLSNSVVASTQPSTPITTGASRCGTGSVALTASGAGVDQDYKWYSALTGGLLLQTGGATYATPSITATTTYYAVIYNTTVTTCESSPRTAVIATVNALLTAPTITAGGSTTFCSGGSVTLTSSVGTSFLWSTGATTASISPTTGGSYTVQVANASGCQSAVSAATVVTVTVPPATTGVSICVGGSGTLTASGACGSNVVVTEISSSGTFTVPAGVTSITVEAWGAGGAGGGSGSGSNARPGGGGGAYVKGTITTTAGTNYAVVIGAGGATQTNNGTVTTFGGAGTFSADYGRGGSSGNTAGTGGTTGSSFVIASATSVTKTAGSSGNGRSNPVGGNGGDAGNATGSGGAGGNGTDGSAGTTPGGGGGGAGYNSNGGAGANGHVTVTYTIPGSIDWYTAVSSGTKIGSGSPFNPVGVADSGLANTNTAGTTTYYAECSLNPGCRTPADFVIKAVPSAPTGTIIQLDCVTTTGSIVLSGLPTGTWDLYQNGNAIPVITGGTGTTTTISGLPVGSYMYTVSNGICASVASTSFVITAPTTNTWNGIAWSNGTPDSTQKLVFTGNYPPATDPNVDIVGCSCKVTGSATVTIKSGITMTITNEVTVLGPGTLTFDYDQTVGANPINSASLVQINNVNTNSGNIIYKRMTNTAVASTDYTYWSSPVLPETLGGVSQNKSLPSNYYSYDSTVDNWQQASATTAMVAGAGYIIGGPKPPNPVSTYLATFNGIPNNGAISLTTGITRNSSYLLGNPYPSAINADKFLQENATVLGGTLYFWTHNTAMQNRNLILSTAGSGALAYTSNDYASYNVTGGVGIDPLSTTSAAINGGGNISVPSGIIAAGQGFFGSILASPTGTAIVYNNDIRVAGTSGNNSQFFRTSNTKAKTANAIEKDRIWLDLSNTQGAFKQTLVGYVTGATNEYDSRFDGESFDGNEFVDFYSVLQTKNLTIQGRTLPFDEKDVVPLGFRSSIDGSFSINIDQVDGLLTNQAVFIEDKLTNTTADLKSGNYTFTTVAGTFNDRFVLHYTNKTLASANFDAQTNTVLVSNKNKEIKINSFAETIDKVTIYDVLGRQIYQKINVNSNELTIANLVSSQQTLVVKTTLQNGTTVTDKIIY